MISKFTKRYTTTYVYRLPVGTSRDSAVQWICKLVNSQVIKTSRVILQDIQRRSDEGNLTTECFPPLNNLEIQQQIDARNTDCITFSGTFQDKILAVCLDLATFDVNIAMSNTDLIDEKTIEAILHLT